MAFKRKTYKGICDDTDEHFVFDTAAVGQSETPVPGTNVTEIIVEAELTALFNLINALLKHRKAGVAYDRAGVLKSSGCVLDHRRQLCGRSKIKAEWSHTFFLSGIF